MDNAKKATSNGKIIESVNAKKLQEMDLPTPSIIVENMLYQGFSVLAGAPKVGKSWRGFYHAKRKNTYSSRIFYT